MKVKNNNILFLKKRKTKCIDLAIYRQINILMNQTLMYRSTGIPTDKYTDQSDTKVPTDKHIKVPIDRNQRNSTNISNHKKLNKKDSSFEEDREKIQTS